jgi:predicted DNA-binding WGR domain protein
VLFDEHRYYVAAWQPTLFGWGVMSVWGRKGETQNLRVEPFPSLAEAWPAIRGHIRARLRHGYQIVGEG